jgi:hypothetical protein
MKRRKTLHSATVVRGHGFVGRWADGALGWALPDHLTGTSGHNEPPADRDYTRGEPESAVLCEITVRVVRDSLGRLIYRRFPPSKD